MAALIQSRTGTNPELIEGGRGEFTVWVDGVMVAKKTPHGFPTDEEVVAGVAGAIG